MRINQFINSFMAVFLCAGAVISAEAATVATTSPLTIKVKIVPPTCSVKAPADIEFTNVKAGTQRYPSFDITITCLAAVPTKVKASVLTGIKNPDETSVQMMARAAGVATSAARDGVNLKLYYNATAIKFTGNETDSFCVGDFTSTATRTCTITPETDISRGTTGFDYGEATAAIKFDVIYAI